MGLKQHHFTHYVALVLAILGAVFQIVSVATHEWALVSVGNFGLWKLCLDSTSSCDDIPDTYESDQLDASRGLSVTGVVLSILSFIVGIVHLKAHKKSLHITAFILSFLAASCKLIGSGLYVDLMEDDFHDSSIGYSLALSFTAGTLATVAGLCFLVAKCLDPGLMV